MRIYSEIFEIIDLFTPLPVHTTGIVGIETKTYRPLTQRRPLSLRVLSDLPHKFQTPAMLILA